MTIDIEFGWQAPGVSGLDGGGNDDEGEEGGSAAGFVRCPDADHDVCDAKYGFPRAARRSVGLSSADCKPIYMTFQDYSLITIDEFFALAATLAHWKGVIWRERRKWWTYWAAKARELYGDRARVRISC